jgi:hypothetical protein
MKKAVNPVSLEIEKLDITTAEFCRKNKLNYGSFHNTISGKSPSRYIAKHLAENFPNLFNLLPEVSRKKLRGEYHGCNIPR